MPQKLPTSARSRGNAQRLFLREKSLRASNPSAASVTAVIAADTRKVSEYGRQLREKQKVRRMYGVNENQFHRYYDKARSSSKNSSERLLQLLELRLDNVVYRAGFGLTRSQARQFVTHGLFTVNGARVDIPSYTVSVGDIVKSRKSADFWADRAFDMTPSWINLDKKDLSATILSLPTRDHSDPDINEQLIIEFYSR